MIKVSLAAILLLLSFTSFSQISIEGNLKDSATGEALAYANVYFQKSYQGSLSNLEGDFIVSSDSVYKNDTLVMSLIGYETLKLPVSGIKSPLQLTMTSKSYQLHEVVILPKPAEYYVLKAAQNIPENYGTTAFNSQVYYRELLKENGEFSHFIEAILGAYNKGYGDTIDSNQLSIATSKVYEDIEDIQFMRKQIDKREDKARKKAKKKGEEFDEDKEGFSINLGNPIFLFNYNVLRTRRSFFDSEKIKDYEFKIEGVIDSGDDKLLVISFDQRTNVKEALFKGKMYLEEESLAVVSVEYSYSERGKKYLIPTTTEAAMWVLGIKFEGPYLDVTIRSKKVADRWLLSDVLVSANANLEKRHLFSDNELSQFEAEIFFSLLEHDFERAEKLAPEALVTVKPAFKRQLKHEPENPLWEKYTLIKPERFLDKF
ncbi:MAG TPA: hypothetical protein DCS15_05790 [Flavobacteriales bacterium]|jgi:hypothetical protein|nr:carboxypeptidase-like regulatory domain-containing protein [Salibacteraceae bacterium]HAS35978.1 hypothetical protein [Flavobacteriales bacterium]